MTDVTVTIRFHYIKRLPKLRYLIIAVERLVERFILVINQVIGINNLLFVSAVFNLKCDV